MSYAKDATGRPVWSPCCGQPTTQSEPHDTASYYQCILCDRTFSLPQPDKPNRANR